MSSSRSGTSALLAGFRHWLVQHRGICDRAVAAHLANARDLTALFGAAIDELDAACMRRALPRRTEGLGPATTPLPCGTSCAILPLPGSVRPASKVQFPVSPFIALRNCHNTSRPRMSRRPSPPAIPAGRPVSAIGRSSFCWPGWDFAPVTSSIFASRISICGAPSCGSAANPAGGRPCRFHRMSAMRWSTTLQTIARGSPSREYSCVCASHSIRFPAPAPFRSW